MDVLIRSTNTEYVIRHLAKFRDDDGAHLVQRLRSLEIATVQAHKGLG